jgi:hypothetical protein
LNPSVSHCHVTNPFLIKSFTSELRNSATSERSFVRSNGFNNWINIVDKLNCRVNHFFSIQSDPDIVEGCTSFGESEVRRKRRGVTLDDVLF